MNTITEPSAAGRRAAVTGSVAAAGASTATAVNCAVVPPHILDRIACQDDGSLGDRARRTLEHDAAQRTRRNLTAAVDATAAPPRAASDRPHRAVHDAGHGEDLPGRKVRGEGGKAVKDASANRAYDGLGATFEMYLKAYGRHSIDDAGLPLVASVHYGQDYDNAFWNGAQMVFGDGDSRLFTDFTVCLDVIGHELTHGVTQYSANLEYFGESGALNESVSDVFGSLIKQFALGQTAAEADWLIGAGLLAPGVRGTALRSLKAPGTAYDDDLLGKDPQPATMDGYLTTSQDNGGVHVNSGIPNHAFYLAAQALGGHAWERAGQIWYDTLTGGRLSANADFAEFAGLTLQAARHRYGAHGEEHHAVRDAWQRVGVTVGTHRSVPAQPTAEQAEQAAPRGEQSRAEG